MSSGFLIWVMAGGVIGLVWLVRFIFIGVARKQRTILSSDSHLGPLERAPRVTVLVPGKDEQDNIESCIRTLMDQDYPNYEVVAIDDRSGDRTPQILARLGAEFGERLRVISIERLREGWFGKNNALREGVQAATGEWLLFVDADCRQTSHRTISVGMKEVLANGVDFLSIVYVLDLPEWWERVIQPVCALVLIRWFLPSAVNDPRRKTAYANGGFMLVSRRCYEGIGGHERVRAELNEDIQLARNAKEGGFRLRVVENEDLFRSRMYGTPGEAWRGWSRIFYGSLGSKGKLIVSILMVGVFSLLPWCGVVVGLTGWGGSEWSSTRYWMVGTGCWLGAVVLMQAAMWRFYGIMQVPRVWSLAYVLGAVVAFLILINSLLKALGVTSTTWRGTTYRGDRVANDRSSMFTAS